PQEMAAAQLVDKVVLLLAKTAELPAELAGFHIVGLQPVVMQGLDNGPDGEEAVDGRRQLQIVNKVDVLVIRAERTDERVLPEQLRLALFESVLHPRGRSLADLAVAGHPVQAQARIRLPAQLAGSSIDCMNTEVAAVDDQGNGVGIRLDVERDREEGWQDRQAALLLGLDGVRQPAPGHVLAARELAPRGFQERCAADALGIAAGVATEHRPSGERPRIGASNLIQLLRQVFEGHGLAVEYHAVLAGPGLQSLPGLLGVSLVAD